MGIERILEPEVMDTPEEARDYNAMDHSEVNRKFVDDLLAGPVGPRVIDLGCGPAAIPIELCQRAPSVEMNVLVVLSAQRVRTPAIRAACSAALEAVPVMWARSPPGA